MAPLSPHDARLLLRLADIQHAFVLLELPNALLRDFVLALVLLKDNEIKVFGGNELLDVANEGVSHRSSTGPRTHRASSSYIQGMSLQARPAKIRGARCLLRVTKAGEKLAWTKQQ